MELVICGLHRNPTRRVKAPQGGFVVHPTIHLNGTSKERLIEGWSDAFDALRIALEKLAEAAPNGRDYYVQESGAYELARQEHVERMRKIQSVMVDLQTLCEKADMP